VDPSGKLVIVSGGLGSIGSSLADSLAEIGARIAVLDIHEATSASPTPPHPIYHVDLADEHSVASVLEDLVRDLGEPAILVNCAGLIHSEPLVNITNPNQRHHSRETWDAVLRSNLTATFNLSSQVAERMVMKRIRGLVINFSSISAQGNPGQSAYAAAKAGVEALTKVWARELGPFGIRSVAIAPGFIATSSTEAALTKEAIADLKRRTPLMRLGTTEEIFSAVRFAIENDYLTGTTIAINGGLAL